MVVEGTQFKIGLRFYLAENKAKLSPIFQFVFLAPARLLLGALEAAAVGLQADVQILNYPPLFWPKKRGG